MEDDKALKFVCKLCSKKYPCRKSLGGHMKSHVIASSSESEKRVEACKKKISSSSSEGQHNLVKDSEMAEFVNGQSNYGLRENPKKTWRAAADSSFLLPQERVCKQCGKGFQSLKALCGHMACHSDKDKGLKDDQSWSTESQKLVLDSYSDSEAEYQLLRTRSGKCKRFSSSVSDYDQQEQEEVAVCLMLLSMDFMNKDGVSSVLESSDNFSVVVETKSSSSDVKTGDDEWLNHVRKWNEAFQKKKIGDGKKKICDLDAEIPEMDNSDSGCFLDECVKTESDVSVDGIYGDRFRSRLNKITADRTELRKEVRMENWYDNSCAASNSARFESRKGKCSQKNGELQKKSGRKMKDISPEAETSKNPQKRSKYECFNCKKAFKSFQALGGHRPCHKRVIIQETMYESDENYLDEEAELRRDVKTGVGASKRRDVAKTSSPYGEKKLNLTKNKGHVCPFCQRVFMNGQALGGHKRSHFIGGHSWNVNQSPAVKTKLLDLNLPPDEGEDDN